MTQMFTRDMRAPPTQGRPETQKFGRIKAVRPAGSETEIDVCQPNGVCLTALVHDQSLDAGSSGAVVGRNIWVSGRLDGASLQARAFAVYAEEP